MMMKAFLRTGILPEVGRNESVENGVVEVLRRGMKREVVDPYVVGTGVVAGDVDGVGLNESQILP